MVSLFSVQLLNSYGHFSVLEIKITLSQRHVEKRYFLGKTNTAIHGVDEDVTATAELTSKHECVNAGPLFAKSAHH